MSNGWMENKIVDILATKRNAISMGPFGSNIKKENFVSNGVPVIKGGNLTDGYLIEDNFDFLTEEKADELRTSMAFRGDIVITHRGTIGQVGLVPEDSKYEKYIVSQSQLKFSLDTQKADPYFVFYFFKTRVGQYRLLQNASQVGVPAIARASSSVKDILIPTPPLLEQKRIASLLRALDDKIKNNRRMNETLEEMARAIFKSWFVDFDPVHAKASGNPPAHMDADTAALFPNSFGDNGLPVGWSVGTYGDAMSIYDSKRVPLSKHQREKKQGVFPYYGATSCMDHVDEYLFDGIYLLMGEDGSVVRENGTPFLQYVWGKFWVNNHAHVLKGANGFSTEHLFCGLSSVNVTPYVTGAVQLKINQANMKRIPIVVPTQPILSAFSDRVLPLFNKRRLNIEENQTLAELRDTLLPKLMSGEIRVKDAEHEVETVI